MTLGASYVKVPPPARPAGAPPWKIKRQWRYRLGTSSLEPERLAMVTAACGDLHMLRSHATERQHGMARHGIHDTRVYVYKHVPKKGTDRCTRAEVRRDDQGSARSGCWSLGKATHRGLHAAKPSPEGLSPPGALEGNALVVEKAAQKIAAVAHARRRGGGGAPYDLVDGRDVHRPAEDQVIVDGVISDPSDEECAELAPIANRCGLFPCTDTGTRRRSTSGVVMRTYAWLRAEHRSRIEDYRVSAHDVRADSLIAATQGGPRRADQVDNLNHPLSKEEKDIKKKMARQQPEGPPPSTSARHRCALSARRGGDGSRGDGNRTGMDVQPVRS